MTAARLGELLRSARLHAKVSRADLAQQVGVSTRLVAELERGQRPNVSLETALRLLAAVGRTVELVDPDAQGAPSGALIKDGNARVARAAERRQTWVGRRIELHDEGGEPRATGAPARRLAQLTRVVRQAHALMTAARKSSRTRRSTARQAG